MTVTLVCVDAIQNHQKFWTGEVLANGDLKVAWGRVGTKGQEKVHPIQDRAIAQIKLNKLIQEKQAKGYRQQVIEVEPELLPFETLANGAEILAQMQAIEALLQRWQQVIEVRFDRQTGRLISQIGVFTHDVILDAQRILDAGANQISSQAQLENYLRLIPLRMGRLNPIDLFGNQTKLAQQTALLDDLQDCLTRIATMRSLIQAELANPTMLVTDKAQWVEWGLAMAVGTQAVVSEERMGAIQW